MPTFHLIPNSSTSVTIDVPAGCVAVELAPGRAPRRMRHAGPGAYRVRVARLGIAWPRAVVVAPAGEWYSWQALPASKVDQLLAVKLAGWRDPTKPPLA